MMWLLSSAILFSSCTMIGDYTDSERRLIRLNSTKGAIAGALIGAATGAIVGHATGEKNGAQKGAVGGAVVGAMAGGVFGRERALRHIQEMRDYNRELTTYINAAEASAKEHGSTPRIAPESVKQKIDRIAKIEKIAVTFHKDMRSNKTLSLSLCLDFQRELFKLSRNKGRLEKLYVDQFLSPGEDQGGRKEGSRGGRGRTEAE